MLRDKARQNGVAWTIRRAAYHLWRILARRLEARHS